MSNRKLIHRIAAVAGATCLALTIWASPVATVPVQAAPPNSGEASPQYDIIEWRWKVENGALWRRLYNYSIGDWVGPWEYVCPYPPS